MGPADWRMAD